MKVVDINKLKGVLSIHVLNKLPVIEIPDNARLINANDLFSWFDGKSTSKYPVKDGKQYDTLMMYEIFDEIDEAETILET